jgi:magnesium-transporting ATPase (P-type)
MHVWILTGDKLETAITIAYSSSIIQKVNTDPPSI